MFDFNIVAILAAVIASMVIGAVWYSPMVFGKVWMKLTGKNTQELKNPAFSYIVMTVVAFLQALVLSQFIGFVGAGSTYQGMITGFWAWFGFVATTQASGFVFQGKSWRLYLLDNGYHLISLMLMGIILASWP